MSDTITAWHDMQEDAIANSGSVKSECKYIFLPYIVTLY